MDDDTKGEIKDLVLEVLNSYNVTKFPGEKKKTPEAAENTIKVAQSYQRLKQKIATEDPDGIFWMTFKDGKFAAGEMGGLYSSDEALIRTLRTWIMGILVQIGKEE